MASPLESGRRSNAQWPTEHREGNGSFESPTLSNTRSDDEAGGPEHEEELRLAGYLSNLC